ncbi:hypothetical protein BCAR13_480005 [Paraburkholderia caribensis]|nr:hypothetical protein BCAR13_480005 [Paraburkholderia caribensis]
MRWTCSGVPSGVDGSALAEPANVLAAVANPDAPASFRKPRREKVADWVADGVLSGSSGVVSGALFFDMSVVLASEGQPTRGQAAAQARRRRKGTGRKRDSGDTIFPNLLPRCDSPITTLARLRPARVL